jgi:hypothetical protein
MNGKVITRHAQNPLKVGDVIPTLCGKPLSVFTGAHELVNVGHSVNCPECRVVINYVRRCVSVTGYACTRAA